MRTLHDQAVKVSTDFGSHEECRHLGGGGRRTRVKTLLPLQVRPKRKEEQKNELFKTLH